MSHALIVSTSAASLAGTPTGVWLEEVAVGTVELMGGADKTLEARLKAAGGLYTAGPDWAPHVVVDGKVVTGQNPASSAATAVAAVKAAAESLTPAVEAGGE